jgi:cation-transporting P-type ATPase F
MLRCCWFAIVVKMMEPTEATHALAVHEVLLLHDTDKDHGLTQHEANARLERFGANVLPEFSQHGPVVMFLLQFNSPLIYVLMAASVITALIGEWVDTAVILAVVLVNAIVGYIQEHRASKALEALAEFTRTQAIVVRNGEPQTIDSRDVVPGDVIILEAGAKVPADLRLWQVNELRVDESALTGESLPVDKRCIDLSSQTVLGDRVNMAYSSTLVTAGNGRGVCVATGRETEIGRIHQLMGQAAGVDTPLTRKLGRLSIWLTFAILALTAFTFILGLVRGEPLAQMITSAVAIAVAAIPEGLPAVVTITLAIGVSRMAQRNAIIRKLPAVETLGSTTVICTDKTGTLTENRMTVQYVYAHRQVHDMRANPSSAIQEVLRAGVLCNNATANIGDPTEIALVHAAVAQDITPDAEHQMRPRANEIPFDSELRYMATLHRESDGRQTIYLKGATEEVLALCADEASPNGGVEPLDRDRITVQVEQFGEQALRVLAFARTEVSADWDFASHALSDVPLTFLGLQAMADPPRPEAIRAIAACHSAGIDVKMITGDHMQTAKAIAREIGLSKEAEPTVLSGTQISEMSPTELAESLPSVNVIARVSAEQKLRIVEALQAKEHVVAMTGDGINDAPALKQADIGIAMGDSGTEVAKEAAAMVLTDDNFASIESAIEEGRSVYANLTKFITWALPTNVGQGLIIMVAIIASLSLPILPVQILWVNMTTAVALGLTLAFEPTEPSTMQQPPRPPRQPILTRSVVMRILFVGFLMLIGAYLMFEVALASGAPIETARTSAVNAVVAMQIGYLFNCRSLDSSWWSVGAFSNRILLIGIAIMVALQMLFTYAPFMQLIFQTGPMGWQAWLGVSALGVATALIVGVEKWIRARVRTYASVSSNVGAVPPRRLGNHHASDKSAGSG